MPCKQGQALLDRYQATVSVRADARDRLLLDLSHRNDAEEHLIRTQTTYNQTFVDWFTHRSACTQCSADSAENDIEQFASV